MGRATRRVLWGLYAAVNVPLILWSLVHFGPLDWTVIADTPAAFFRGDLYALGPVPFVWSPLFAFAMAPLVPFGYPGWVALHLVAVGFLRDRRLMILAALSVGFWADLVLGNTVTFVFVAAILALRGNQLAIAAYLVLSVLMPRPIQLPLLVWILWHRPGWRWPFVTMAGLHGVAVLLTGYGDEWIAALTIVAPQQMALDTNWSPTQYIGLAWLIIGIPLSVLLTWRGYVGFAGLLMSPYVFPQYLLLGLITVQRERDRWSCWSCPGNSLDIKRIPVRLRYNAGSSVRVIRDSARAGADTLRMRVNWARGRYRSPALRAILADDLADPLGHHIRSGAAKPPDQVGSQ